MGGRTIVVTSSDDGSVDFASCSNAETEKMWSMLSKEKRSTWISLYKVLVLARKCVHIESGVAGVLSAKPRLSEDGDVTIFMYEGDAVCVEVTKFLARRTTYTKDERCAIALRKNEAEKGHTFLFESLQEASVAFVKCCDLAGCRSPSTMICESRDVAEYCSEEHRKEAWPSSHSLSCLSVSHIHAPNVKSGAGARHKIIHVSTPCPPLARACTPPPVLKNFHSVLHAAAHTLLTAHARVALPH